MKFSGVARLAVFQGGQMKTQFSCRLLQEIDRVFRRPAGFAVLPVKKQDVIESICCLLNSESRVGDSLLAEVRFALGFLGPLPKRLKRLMNRSRRPAERS